jgi:hypothetical protein
MRCLTLLLIPAALMAAQARYARLGEFEGKVEVQLTAAADWMAAERNLPLPEAAWLRTGEASRLEIELDEGSAWRLGPDSLSGIADYARLSTGQRVTLLVLDRGLAYFTGRPEGRDALTLAVPGAQVTLTRAARVRLEAQDDWSQITVLEGAVRFSSPTAEIDLREGQTTRVEPANPARFFLIKKMSPLELDAWNEARNQALAPGGSSGHVMHRYGVADLDSAGEWIQTEDLGAVWRPKEQEGFLPFQKGRWRWYDALGYTWVAEERWGWLPYHHGRWMRRENLGWIWAPAKNDIFKPGDVYWLRGANLAGWGPLAPGELWAPAGPETDTPRQFLNVHTTFATFSPGATLIDPAGFAARPQEALVVASFAAALPSPPFVASRLDAIRPPLITRARITPVVESAVFRSESVTAPAPVVVNIPPPPPPVVIVTEPPPEPAPAPPPVAYPVPVYTGIVMMTPPKQQTPARGVTSREAAPRRSLPGTREAAVRPARPAPGPIRRDNRFRSDHEKEMAAEVIRDLAANDFAKALLDLDTWTRRFPRSDFEEDRAYYYVVSYDGNLQPARVVDAARPLLASRADTALQDPRQMILALYLVTSNVMKLMPPTRDQLAMGELAARNLLAAVPAYFVAQNKPLETSEADWLKARADLERAAMTTLALVGKRPRDAKFR